MLKLLACLAPCLCILWCGIFLEECRCDSFNKECQVRSVKSAWPRVPLHTVVWYIFFEESHLNSGWASAYCGIFFEESPLTSSKRAPNLSRIHACIASQSVKTRPTTATANLGP